MVQISNYVVSEDARHHRLASPLSSVSTLVLGLYVALFQSGLASYAGAEMGSATWLTRIVFLVYGAAAVIAPAAVFSGLTPRKPVVAVWVFTALALAPLLFSHDAIGSVTKSYAIGLVSVATLCVVSLCADLRRVAQFSASIICVASVCCLLDACFFDGFSNAAGRGAFLYINPNVAALALLLGTAASAWSIPGRWLPALLILVGAAVFATLSRSAMLMATLTLAACAPLLSENWRLNMREMRAGIRPAAVVGACALVLFGAVWNNNPAFPVALDNGFHGVITVVKWLKVGYEQIGGPSSADGTDEEDMATAIQLVEANNSASARALLAERAWHQFRTGPRTGIGLERAFALAPHNSYLLFADAFGYVGWLVIPGLIALILYLGGWRRGLPAALLVTVSALFSHDLLFALPLVASFVLIFSNVKKEERRTSESTPETSRVMLACVAALIAGMCLLTYTSERHRVPSYEITASGSRIEHYAGYAYYIPLPRISPAGIFRLNAEEKEGSGGGGIVVLENGKPLPTGNEKTETIVAHGYGLYGYHNMWAIFSSRDGSNPSANGRSYQVDATVVIHPLFPIAVLTCVAWAIFWVAPMIFWFLSTTYYRFRDPA